MLEFRPWPKIARLNRDIIITEKIDGTNAAVHVVPDNSNYELGGFPAGHVIDPGTGRGYIVGAQSRKRLITPQDDNFGFAAWVRDNAVALATTLGEGTHFGEWWGSGIQRGYGLSNGKRYFSLFNTKRWGDTCALAAAVPGLRCVPVLHEGVFDDASIDAALRDLEDYGSYAKVGYNRPEGIVVYHTAANTMFKVTLEGDEAPKGSAA